MWETDDCEVKEAFFAKYLEGARPGARKTSVDVLTKLLDEKLGREGAAAGGPPSPPRGASSPRGSDSPPQAPSRSRSPSDRANDRAAGGGSAPRLNREARDLLGDGSPLPRFRAGSRRQPGFYNTDAALEDDNLTRQDPIDSADDDGRERDASETVEDDGRRVSVGTGVRGAAEGDVDDAVIDKSIAVQRLVHSKEADVEEPSPDDSCVECEDVFAPGNRSPGLVPVFLGDQLGDCRHWFHHECFKRSFQAAVHGFNPSEKSGFAQAIAEDYPHDFGACFCPATACRRVRTTFHFNDLELQWLRRSQKLLPRIPRGAATRAAMIRIL